MTNKIFYFFFSDPLTYYFFVHAQIFFENTKNTILLEPVYTQFLTVEKKCIYFLKQTVKN